jgi:hypothetical protein
MAITIEEIKYTPEPLKAGQKVKATFKIKADAGVASVRIYTPDYRTLEARDDGTNGDDVAGDGTYTLVTDVPYDAMPGTYDITLVVTDKNNEVLRKTAQIRIA